jgi:hypothetical protein
LLSHRIKEGGIYQKTLYISNVRVQSPICKIFVKKQGYVLMNRDTAGCHSCGFLFPVPERQAFQEQGFIL